MRNLIHNFILQIIFITNTNPQVVQRLGSTWLWFQELYKCLTTDKLIILQHFKQKKYPTQGAKKIIFTACHSGKPKLAFTSPDIISTSPKSFLTSRIDFTVLLLFEFLKKHHLPAGKLKTEFTSPIAKSTSPGLSDTTLFTRCKPLIPCTSNGYSYSQEKPTSIFS